MSRSLRQTSESNHHKQMWNPFTAGKQPQVINQKRHLPVKQHISEECFIGQTKEDEYPDHLYNPTMSTRDALDKRWVHHGGWVNPQIRGGYFSCNKALQRRRSKRLESALYISTEVSPEHCQSNPSEDTITVVNLKSVFRAPSTFWRAVLPNGRGIQLQSPMVFTAVDSDSERRVAPSGDQSLPCPPRHLLHSASLCSPNQMASPVAAVVNPRRTVHHRSGARKQTKQKTFSTPVERLYKASRSRKPVSRSVYCTQTSNTDPRTYPVQPR